MKRFLTAILVVLVGCSGLEDFRPESRLAVKDIAVTKSETVGARARYDEATREIFWTGGDKYFYYTFGISDVFSDVTVGTLGSASHITEIIPVAYDLSNDNTVVIGSTGSKVGAVSSKTKTDVTITNGIPVVQDGTVEGSYVNLGIANLQTQDAAVLGSRQAFISFNLLTGTVGDETVKFFTVNGKAGEIVCGNATFAIESAEVSAVSSGTTIAVNVTAVAQHNYYVALAPGTYTEGLRICLYDKGIVDATTGTITGGHICGYVDTGSDIELKAGRILALGDLTAHKTVPASGTDDCLIVHPSDAHIVKLSDFVQTKKLWIEHKPTDMTDIDFEYSVPGIIQAERGPDEEYNGTNYMTVIVTPICDDITDAAEEKVCTLTVKDRYPAPGTTPASATCTVTVGMFIDLGLPSGTLWAATYVKETGASPALALTTSVAETGSYFPWSWTHSRPQNDDMQLIWRWGEWSALFPEADRPSFKVPYTTDRYDVLLELDMTGGFYMSRNVVPEQYDICHCCHSSLSLPDASQISELVDSTYCVNCYTYGGNIFCKLTSNVEYYEDVSILIRSSGSQTLPGKIFNVNSVSGFWSRTLNEHPSETLTDYGFNPGTTHGYYRVRLDWYCQYATTSTRISAGIFKDGKLSEALVWEGYPAKPVKSKTPPSTP